jgi:transposase
MNNVPLFVGLDYHQDSVQLCVLDTEGKVLLNRSSRNDWKELHRLVSPLGAVQRVGIEACCGAADLAEELVERAGWNVSLGHPAYIARMKGSPDKTDYSDSHLVADLTRVGYLPRVWLAPSAIRELRQLVTHRQRLVDQRRAAKLQVGGVLREQRVKIDPTRSGTRWTRAWITCVRHSPHFSRHVSWIVGELLDEITRLDAKILAVDGKLREATGDDKVITRLMEQEGIGEVTAWVLRAYVGNFDRFRTGKQLARYCGMSPCNASSGARQSDAGLINGCNKLLRATIVQAAHRLVRTNPRWSQLAESLVRRGKPRCVAVAAVGNRWLRTLHHAMKEQGVARESEKKVSKKKKRAEK